MNKDLARKKAIEAYKEDCADHARWEKEGWIFEEDPRKYGKIISHEAYDFFEYEGKKIKCDPCCILKFDSGKTYRSVFAPSCSFYSELSK